MKKIHIIGIVVIAVSIGAIMASLASSSTYAAFSEAAASPSSEFHVVGTLDKNKDRIYDPKTNPNLFTFFMVDSAGIEKKVILHKAEPPDFERSEKLVIIGKCKGEVFEARDILMKCPSKYNDGKPVESGQQSETKQQ
jgi:cytochrome c-type biogenesis protein CcmE